MQRRIDRCGRMGQVRLTAGRRILPCARPSVAQGSLSIGSRCIPCSEPLLLCLAGRLLLLALACLLRSLLDVVRLLSELTFRFPTGSPPKGCSQTQIRAVGQFSINDTPLLDTFTISVHFTPPLFHLFIHWDMRVHTFVSLVGLLGSS